MSNNTMAMEGGDPVSGNFEFLGAKSHFWGLMLITVSIGAVIMEVSTPFLAERLRNRLAWQLSGEHTEAKNQIQAMLQTGTVKATVFAQLQLSLGVIGWLAGLFFSLLYGQQLSGPTSITTALFFCYFLLVSALHYGTYLGVFLQRAHGTARLISLIIYAAANTAFYLGTGPLASQCTSSVELFGVVLRALVNPRVWAPVLSFGLFVTLPPLIVSELAMRGRSAPSSPRLGFFRHFFLLGTNAVLVVAAMRWNAELSAFFAAAAYSWGWCGSPSPAALASTCGQDATCAAQQTREPISPMLSLLAHAAVLVPLAWVVLDRYVKVWQLLLNKALFFHHRTLFSLDPNDFWMQHFSDLFEVTFPLPMQRLFASCRSVAESPLVDWYANITQLFNSAAADGVELPDLDTGLTRLLRLLSTFESLSTIINSCATAVRARSISIPTRLFAGFMLENSVGLDLSGISLRVVQHTRRSFNGIPLPRFCWRRRPIASLSLQQETPWLPEEHKATQEGLLAFHLNFRIYTAAVCRQLRKLEKQLNTPPSLHVSPYWRRILNGSCDDAPLPFFELPITESNSPPQVEPAPARDLFSSRLRLVSILKDELGPLQEPDEDDSSVADEDEQRDAWEVDPDDSLYSEWQKCLNEEASGESSARPMDAATGSWWLFPALRAVTTALVSGGPLPQSGSVPLTRSFFGILRAVNFASRQDFPKVISSIGESTAILTDSLFGTFDGAIQPSAVIGTWRRWLATLAAFCCGRGRSPKPTDSAFDKLSSIIKKRNKRNVFGVHKGSQFELQLVIKEADLTFRMPLIILDGAELKGVLFEEVLLRNSLNAFTQGCKAVRDARLRSVLLRAAAQQVVPVPHPLRIASAPHVAPLTLHERDRLVEAVSTATKTLLEHCRDIDEATAAMIGVVEGGSNSNPHAAALMAMLSLYRGVTGKFGSIYSVESGVGEDALARWQNLHIGDDVLAINPDRGTVERIVGHLMAVPRTAIEASGRWVHLHRTSLLYLLTFSLHFSESYCRAYKMARAQFQPIVVAPRRSHQDVRQRMLDPQITAEGTQHVSFVSADDSDLSVEELAARVFGCLAALLVDKVVPA